LPAPQGETGPQKGAATTAMMKLVYSQTSPYARKARVTIRELGLLAEVEEVTVGARPDAVVPEINVLNPLGRIPALLTPDGKGIFDSRVVSRYLDAHAGGTLYPPGNWDVPVLEALAAGILDSAVSMAYEVRLRPAEKVSADWIEWQWAKIARALDAVEADWLGRLEGPLDAGQIALGCALGYLDLRHDARGWRTTCPGLAAWEARFAARPSMAETVPQG